MGSSKSRSMTATGFTDLQLQYVYLDSFVVAFVHKPVYTLANKNSLLSGKAVNGRFIFTYNAKDSSFLYVKKLD